MPEVSPDWKSVTEGGIGRAKPLRNKRTRGGRATVAAIHAAKCRTCRLCGATAPVTAHHLIPRGQGGQWHFDNIVGLCGSGVTGCHGLIEDNEPTALAALAAALTDSEYAYLIEEYGEGALERLFGVGGTRSVPGESSTDARRPA